MNLKELAHMIRAMVDGWEDLKLEAILQAIEKDKIDNDLMINLVVLGLGKE